MTLLQIRTGSAAALVPFPAHRGARVGRVARLGFRLKRWIARDGHPSELLRLSDHLLEDMGMSRAQLEVAALFSPSSPQGSDRTGQPPLSLPTAMKAKGSLRRRRSSQ